MSSLERSTLSPFFPSELVVLAIEYIQLSGARSSRFHSLPVSISDSSTHVDTARSSWLLIEEKIWDYPKLAHKFILRIGYTRLPLTRGKSWIGREPPNKGNMT